MKKIALQEGVNSLRLYVHPDIEGQVADPVRRVRVISRANRLRHDMVALPDFHYKVGNFIPTGTVTASEPDRILPCAVGNGAGCGYCLVNLNAREGDITSGQTDALFGALQQQVAIKATAGRFSPEFCLDVFRHGLDAVPDVTDDERERFDFRGNQFRNQAQADPGVDFARFMPARNHAAIFSDLEVLGGGNHFVELLSARRIVNPELAAHFRIRQDQLLINLHADANATGNMAETFTPYKTFRNWDRVRRELKKMRFHLQFYRHLAHYLKQDEIFSVPVDSRVGRNFLAFFFATANFGAVNRYLLSRKIGRIAAEQLDLGMVPALVTDNVHDLISFEQGLWIHRTGAARATSAAESTFAPFAAHGKPVMVPVALGGPTILGVPGPGTEDTYRSLPHGAGRSIDRSEATGFTLEDIRQVMNRNKVKLFRHGGLDIAREHPEGFRKFETILDTLTSNRLMDVAAILEPIAVLKA